MSFAVHWIKAEIHEYIIRNWRLVKIATTKAQRKLFFNLRSMRPDGQTLTPEHIEGIASKLNVRPEDVSEMEVRLTGRDMSLESQDDDNDDFAPISYLSDEGEQEPGTVLDRRAHDDMQGTGVSNALAVLDPRSRRIIEARWLQDEGGGSTCMNWPMNSACRPSVSVRLNRPRSRKCVAHSPHNAITLLAAGNKKGTAAVPFSVPANTFPIRNRLKYSG